jgi:hypothetical protein
MKLTIVFRFGCQEMDYLQRAGSNEENGVNRVCQPSFPQTVSSGSLKYSGRD